MRFRLLNRFNLIKYHNKFKSTAVEHKKIEIYEKKTPIEHILLRPGMYVGEIESKQTEIWVYDDNLKKMMKTPLIYSPALIKIFDEILVNAADNVHRNKKMKSISVEVKSNKGILSVSIFNDGKGIPVEVHPKENIYIPELIFGHLLTGSNFNDDNKRLTGGRHGYGAKLTNIFSNIFSIETYDSSKKLLYKQSWENNMTKAYPPIITPASESETKLSDFTKITFEPDLAKFQVSNSDIGVKPSHLLKDTVKIFRRRTIDIAACVPTVEVSFNGTKTPINSFKDYVSLFAPSSSSSSEPQNISAKELSGEHTDRNPVFYQKVSDRWEIGVMKSLSGSFENISFVNSVWTPDGGSHVNLVTSQIIRAFQDELSKRGAPIVQPNTIRSRLMVFVRSNIENPSFESQSKLSLSSKPTSFGSTCDLPQTFLKTLVEKSGILDEIMLDIKYREEAKLLKAFSGPRKSSGTNLVDIPKLEDALLAGNTQHALECTLILTEGDSAKALAIAGLEVVGRDKFGVLPLRGKILNVRAAATSQMLKNEELSNICKTLGLNFNETFEKGIKDKGLRYGKVLLMCDQDHDGSHIKGLVINFFQHFWPNLLLNEDFLQQFITPLVKATPIGTQTTNSDRKSSKPILSFYSLQEYQAWRQKVKPDSSSSSIGSPDDNNGTKLNDSGYRIKYYKGLGTNTADEGKEYFRKLDRHLKQFVMNPGGADAIDLAFSKSRAADRRKWLASCYDADTFIDPNKKQIAYGDFVNKELIQFSFSDNQRSIPSVVDGLKPSQRKILYACFKKKLTNDMKVVQLAGYVAEHTAYHHGEASLHAAIVNMAQDFVGSSNVPLLVPSGQFGTRAQGGNDYASPRYIFTRLSPLTRLLFPNEDDAHLKPLEEDGQLVEPKYFLPVIPTLLVNGAQGIGTGWSTFIPTYNPLEVAEYVSHKLQGIMPSKSLQPWVRGFKGPIIQETPDAYLSLGVVSRHRDNMIEIEELPVGKWTEEYKQYLCGLCEGGELKSFREQHTTTHVKFLLYPSVSATWAKSSSSESLITNLKLKSGISLKNMCAFDAKGSLKKYVTPDEIIDEHYIERFKGYETRKDALIKSLLQEEAYSRNKSRFVSQIIRGELDLFSFRNQPENRQKNLMGINELEIIKMLRREGYMSSSDISALSSSKKGVNSDLKVVNDYEYLLDMPLYSLTEQKYANLCKAAEAAESKLNEIRRKSVNDLWQADISSLIAGLRASQGYE